MSNSVSQMADMSIMSFIKIVGETQKSKKMEKYSKHSGLNNRMPGYQVKMGFGLHVGWSIEGAIGSNYKIDASYLSPNVNMSSRLEGATKQYGVPILITGELYDIFTPRTQFYCRQVDAVTMKGATEVYKLYTCDIDSKDIETEKAK
jgi:class 3 adenylate cyclase